MIADKLVAYLEELPTDILVVIHDEYCEANNDIDSEIYSMDNFNDLMEVLDAFRFACQISYGDFNPAHDYFYFNGYGNLVSTNYPRERIYVSDIVDYIIRNEEYFGDDEIKNICTEEAGDELI